MADNDDVDMSLIFTAVLLASCSCVAMSLDADVPHDEGCVVVERCCKKCRKD